MDLDGPLHLFIQGGVVVGGTWKILKTKLHGRKPENISSPERKLKSPVAS